MHFLVAVDGSNESLAALERAIEMADPLGASVTVVHAVNPDVYELGGMEPITTLADADERLIVESLKSAEERGEDILSEAASVAGENGFDVAIELLYGQPAQQIVEYAEEHGVDAVYLGHRGMSDRLEGLLGSVAKSVLGQAEVPVTVVP